MIMREEEPATAGSETDVVPVAQGTIGAVLAAAALAIYATFIASGMLGWRG